MIKSNGMSCFHLIVWYFLLLKRLKTLFHDVLGFPGGSNGKESACSVADRASVPASRSSPGKGNEWQAYLVTQDSGGKRIHLPCRRSEFDPWVRNIPWRRAWQPTPGFLPGESYGQRSLVGYSPWGHKELDTAEQLSNTS